MKRLLLLFALLTSPAHAAGILFLATSGGSSLSCSYTPVTTATQGTAYTGATPSASGGTPSYTFSETGSLPSGLSISSSTGVISGTPTVSGSFAGIQVKVTDSASTVANCGSAFTLVVSASGGPTFVYAGTDQYNGAGGPFTSTSVNIGSATSDRFVVLALTDQNGVAISSVTCNGVALNLDGTPYTVGPGLQFYSGLVGTTGGAGTATIVVNYGSPAGYTGRALAAWVGRGMSHTSGAAATTSPVTGTSITIANNAGDLVLALADYSTSFTGSETLSGTVINSAVAPPTLVAPYLLGAVSSHSPFTFTAGTAENMIAAVYR